MLKSDGCVDFLVGRIKEILSEKGCVTVAIDGRCASGKTTLARALQEKIDCNVFAMDDYFLRPEQRTAERLSEAGGNVDRERFLREILLPVSQRKNVTYRPFCCSTMSLSKEISVETKPVTIIEGSYCCHPELIDLYDLKVFMDIDPALQLDRLIKRNGEEKTKKFVTRWIPLEENYFDKCAVKDKCDVVIEN